MTRDDIIRMAREVSNTPLDHHATPDLFGVSQIERFAALVAAAEREGCAIAGGAAADAGLDVAAAIRARGQQRPEPKVTHLNAWARDRLARHGIQLPEDEEYGNPSF
jgi:hypothetical protein